VGHPSMRIIRATGLFSYDYEAYVTVPENLTVANGGDLLSKQTAAGRSTWSYRNSKPAWRMDFAIAPYEILSTRGLTIFHFPGESEGARQVAGAFDRAIELFSTWFGSLESIGAFSVIELPEGFGAQADVSSILQPAAAFRDPSEMHRLYHEASHLWNVKSTTKPSPRLEEGLATFLQWLAVDKLEGRQEIDRVLDGLVVRVRSRLAEDSRLRQIPLGDYGRENLTDLSYSVGAIFYATLYQIVGPEKFNAIIGGFYQRHRDTGASLDDFVTWAEEVGGPAVRQLAHDWVYTADFVDHVTTAESFEDLTAVYR